jgi:acetamidase/formamidase
MALTQSSFRDPRKQFAMKVLSGFIIEGREAACPGDIVHVSLSVARDLMHSKKAEPYDPAYDAPATKVPPNTVPTPEAVVVKRAEPAEATEVAVESAKPSKGKASASGF